MADLNAWLAYQHERRQRGEVMWEDVESPQDGDYLERIQVPGGWLYRCMLTRQTANGMGTVTHQMSMVFVPEPKA